MRISDWSSDVCSSDLDDPEIAEVAMRFGAEAPFMRPSDLSDDLAPTGVVVQHAIQWLEAQGAAVVNGCCIYATAPFVTAELIAAGYERLIWSRADFAVSVTCFPFQVQRECHIRGDRLQMMDPSAYQIGRAHV